MGFPLSESDPSALDRLSRWEWIYAFTCAIQERMPIFCNRYWPQNTTLYTQGGGVATTVTRVGSNVEIVDGDVKASVDAGGNGWCTDVSVVESGYATHVVNCPNGGFNLFSDYDDGLDPHTDRPQDFDIILAADAFSTPWKVQRVHIGSNGCFTIRIIDPGYTDDELSFFQGKRYEIVRAGGMGWHERVPLATPSTLIPASTSGVVAVATETITALVTDNVTTATATCHHHGYENDDVVTISGATQAAFNGSHKVFDCTDESFRFTVAAGTPKTATTSSSITSVRTSPTGYRIVDFSLVDHWERDRFKGKTLAYDSSAYGAYVRFGTISHNGRHSVTFTSPSPFGAPNGGNYAIMREASPAWFGWQSNDLSHRWYLGLGSDYFTKDINFEATTSSAVVPKKTTTICTNCVEAGGDDEEFADDWVFDVDYLTDPGNVCYVHNEGGVSDSLDKLLNPDLFKTWRGLFVAAEGLLSAFTAPESGVGKSGIFNFTHATWFKWNAINSYSGTASIVDDAVTPRYGFSLGYASHGIPGGTLVYMTVEWHDHQWSDVRWVGDGEEIFLDNPDAVTLTACGSYQYRDATYTYSYGWTRSVPREFLYAYPRHWLRPDYTDGPPALPSEPTATIPGSWFQRDPSSKYAVTDDYYVPNGNDSVASSTVGMTIDSPESLPSDSGEFVRYLGSNRQGTSTDEPGDSLEGEYHVKGKLEAARMPHSSKTGAASAPFVGRIEDASQNWLTFGEWGGYSSTATGGSPTTIIDTSAKPVYYTDPITGVTSMISGDLRWDALTGRWVGFTVEITSGPSKGQQALIRSFVGDPTYQIGFNASDLPSFYWQYAKNVYSIANVGVGDAFTVTVDSVSVTETALSGMSASDLATRLSARINVDISKVTASVEGGQLVIEWPANDSHTVATSTTDGDGHDTQTFTLASSTTNAVTYKIHEPAFILNRWEQRQVRVTSPEGTDKGTFTITNNHAHTLWLDDSSVQINKGDRYKIIEMTPGWVYQREGGKWVQAPNPEGTAPTRVKRYGRPFKGDYFSAVQLNELYRSIASWTHTLESYIWVGDVVVEGPGCNHFRCKDETTESPRTNHWDQGDYFDGFNPNSTWDDGHGGTIGVGGVHDKVNGMFDRALNASGQWNYACGGGEPNVDTGTILNAAPDGTVEFENGFGGAEDYQGWYTAGCSPYSATMEWLFYVDGACGHNYDPSCIQGFAGHGPPLHEQVCMFNDYGSGRNYGVYNLLATSSKPSSGCGMLSGAWALNVQFPDYDIHLHFTDPDGTVTTDTFNRDGIVCINPTIILDWSANLSYV